MADIKFDHNKETLYEAMGFEENYAVEHAEKCAAISMKMISGKLDKTSLLAEEIVNTFSYNDLVYTAAMYVGAETERILEKNPLMSMLAMAVIKQSKEKE